MDDLKQGGKAGLDFSAAKNEGEGSRSADKKYRDAATSFAKSGDPLRRGLEAERDLDQNPGELQRAARIGRAPSAGDLRKDILGDFDKKK